MAVVINPEIISEIAQYLDAGMLCFYHKTNGELAYYPDQLEYSGNEDDWAEETRKIEASPDDYIEFEKMDNREASKVMERFVSDIDDIPTHNKFIEALSLKKPFANFNHLISYYPTLREQWFAHKNQSYIDFVNDQLEMYNGMEEFGEDI